MFRMAESHQHQTEDLTSHKDTNLELEDYENRQLELDQEEFAKIRSTIKLKRIAMGAMLCLMILVCFFVLYFTGSSEHKHNSKVSPPSNKKPNASPGSGTSHNQESSWITDNLGNKYQILDTYERSSTHYTQGFYWTNGQILESAGLHGQSSIQYLEIDENEKRISLKKKTPVDSRYFAEGCDMITENGETKIFQLTWLEQKIFQYNSELQLVKTFDQPSDIIQGWGITHDPAKPCDFIISDSSSTLKIMDCNTMKVKRSAPIMHGGNPLDAMNELEYVEDYLLANVYLTKEIHIIDLETNKSVRKLDFSLLLEKANQHLRERNLLTLDFQQCLNGIAYDKDKQELWITGKEWPLVFKIKLPEEYLKKSK